MEFMEPKITINDQQCSEAESMTIRVALESFATELKSIGLGDDENGKALTEGYLRQIESIRSKIVS